MMPTTGSVLRTPASFRVVVRDGGLYLLGDEAEVRRAVAMALADGHGIREQRTPTGYLVEIGYSRNLDRDGVAEWGAGPDLETAYRYALAANVGSYDDPYETEA